VPQVILFACIIAYIAFRNWLEHDKRRMIHRERMAAIEKGIELPAVVQEVGRRAGNVQRFLLLAGLTWIFVGIGGFIALSAMENSVVPGQVTHDLPAPGSHYLAIIPFGFGIAHLITYLVGQKREQR